MDSIIIIPVSIGYLVVNRDSVLNTNGRVDIRRPEHIAAFTCKSDLVDYLDSLHEKVDEEKESEHIVEVNKKVEKKEKKCPVCKETKPLTTEFWYKNKTRLDGFKSRCKICVQRIDREKRKANKKPSEKDKTAKKEKKKTEIECDIAQEVNDEYNISSDQEIIGYFCDDCGATYQIKPERCTHCNSHRIEFVETEKLKV